MKGIKQAFQSISSKVSNQPKGCVQCTTNDCAKCKGNQNSFDYVFGERNQQPTIAGCFNYLIINDISCYGFNPGECEWSINDGVNGEQFFSGDWGVFMAQYYPNGGGGIYSNIYCTGVPSVYVIYSYTETPLSVSWGITDSLCRKQNGSFTTLCTKSCWTLTFGYDNQNEMYYLDLTPFTTITIYPGTDPVMNPAGFEAYLNSVLNQIYGQNAFCLVSVVGKDVTITIFNVYVDGTPLLYLNNFQMLSFTEITCL